MSDQKQQGSQQERPKQLRFGRLDIDDGLDGDVCITIEARHRSESDACAYLKRSQALELAEWIRKFYGNEPQQHQPTTQEQDRG